PAAKRGDRTRARLTLVAGKRIRSSVAHFAVHYIRLSRSALGSSVVLTFPHRPAGATLSYQLASDVAGTENENRRVLPTASHHGRTLTFRFPHKSSRSARLMHPLLIVSN